MYFDKFEKLCKERKLSYADVARETGINKATISAWKRGDYTPKMNKIETLSNYFGVPIDYFVDNNTVKTADEIHLDVVDELKHKKQGAEKIDNSDIINKEQLAFVFGPGVDEEELKKEEKLPSFDGNAFFKDLEKIEVVQPDGSVKPYYVPRLRNSVAGESMKKAMEEANKIQGIVMKNQKKPESSMEIKLLELFRSLPNQAKAKFLKTAESMADFYSN